MKYRIGYDYYWNYFGNLKYKGRIVRGACINVLFSPIFECSNEINNNNAYLPDQKYEGNYLFQYFNPIINKEENRLDLKPTSLGLKLKKAVSLEIVGFELSVEAHPNKKFKNFPYLESLEISEKEFLQIFQKYHFVELQTTSYFTEEVK